MAFKTAIIGLGNIGSLFDEDPKRKDIWSHTGAYLVSPDTEIVAGSDPDINKLERFSKRCPGVKVYLDYTEMLADNHLDIVSICSPTASHFEILSEVAKSGIKAIFCEKPIASCIEDACQMVSICKEKNIILAINHTRRWDLNYIRVNKYIRQEKIGELKSILGNYPDKIFMVGTHLIDTLRFYGGDVDWVIGAGDNLGSDDPAISGLVSFKNGYRGAIMCCSEKANLIFEIDVIGTKGRVRIIDNGHRVEFFQFEQSDRYSGYQELKKQPSPKSGRGKNPLVSAVKNIVDCIERGGNPACTGEDGLRALEVAVALYDSARNDSRRIKLL